jgi:hypothetical protein
LAQAVINEDASGDIAALQREIQQLKVSKCKLPMFFFNRKWFDSFGYLHQFFHPHLLNS